jgi:hypothetical protein
MRAMRAPVVLWGLLSLAACQAAGEDSDADFPDGPRTVADKEDRTQAIPFRGGAVLSAPKEVHLYWGGYWNGPDGRHERAVLDAFARAAGTSDWYQILTEYRDSRGAPGASVAGASVVIDDSEPGDLVSDRGVRKFVLGELAAGRVAWSTQAIYFVFTPPGTVTSTPWGKTCAAICGYHYRFQGTVFGQGRDVKYALIPYGDCPFDCSSAGVAANGPALDQMTVTLSHELAEAVTDPDITAWTGPRGDPEVADLCDGGFVAEWDGARFAVQELWSNAELACVKAP